MLSKYLKCSFWRLAVWFKTYICSSDSQEIPCILRNMKVYYHIHKRLPFVPILSQINATHALPLYSFKIHFFIFHTWWGFQVLFFLQLSPSKPCMFLFSPHTCHMPNSALLNLLNGIFSGYRSQSSSLCSLLQSPITSSL